MLRRLARATDGTVLVEFAICLPVLLGLFLGAYTLSDMMGCSRKVSLATSTLAELTSRNLSPTTIQGAPSTTSASAFLGASALVIAPYNMANTTETISLLRVCNTTRAFVAWSQTQTQGSSGSVLTTGITAGSTSSPTIVTLPSGLVVPANGSTTYYPLAPTSTSSSTTNVDICANTTASGNTPVVGSAGGYLFVAQVSYTYTPATGLGVPVSTPMADTIYMSPRRT